MLRQLHFIFINIMYMNNKKFLIHYNHVYVKTPDCFNDNDTNLSILYNFTANLNHFIISSKFILLFRNYTNKVLIWVFSVFLRLRNIQYETNFLTIQLRSASVVLSFHQYFWCVSLHQN